MVGIENAGGKIGSIVGFQFGDYIVIKANGLGYSTFSVGGLIAYTRLKWALIKNLILNKTELSLNSSAYIRLVYYDKKRIGSSHKK